MISEKIRTAQGMEGARRATGIPCAATTAQGAHSMPSLLLNPPDPEVPEKAVRRRFTAEYKLNILQQAEACRERRRHWRPLAPGRPLLFSPDHLAPPEGYGMLSGLKPQTAGAKGSARQSPAAGGRPVTQRNRSAPKASEASRADHRDSKKNFTDAGDPAGDLGERRGRLMETVEVLTPEVGTKPACAAVGMSRASVYRLRARRKNAPSGSPKTTVSPPCAEG